MLSSLLEEPRWCSVLRSLTLLCVGALGDINRVNRASAVFKLSIVALRASLDGDLGGD